MRRETMGASLLVAVMAGSCQGALDLDGYRFGNPIDGGAHGGSGGTVATAGGLGAAAGSAGSAARDAGASSGTDVGEGSPAGLSPGASGSQGVPGSGGADEPDASTNEPAGGLAVFDHYNFARGVDAYSVEAPGVLENDLGESLIVSAGSIPTEAKGRIDVEVGGGFTYVPPFPRFWGADFFSYALSGGSNARVRLTVQPDVIDVAELEAGAINGVSLVGTGSAAGIAEAGDVNGDGLGDVIVTSSTDGGGAYVVFGRLESGQVALSDIDLGREDGFALIGTEFASDSAVAGVGDVNGDGLADVIVGNPFADPLDIFNAGSAYVVFGKADRAPVVLADLEQEDGGGFVIFGNAVQAFVGRSLSGAGDVNGDGLDDILVGSQRSTDDPLLGAAYVVLGKGDGASVFLDIIDIELGGGFAISGTGSEVSGAGDVNGDGLDDVILGSQNPCVVFGKTDERRILRASLDGGSLGIAIRSTQPFLHVAGAGDVNGDGLDDMLLGSPETEPGGAAYILFGKRGSQPIDIDTLGSLPDDGFILQSSVDFGVGESVSAAGDVNADGFGDVLIGTRQPNPGGNAVASLAFLVLGQRESTGLDLATLGLGSRTGLIVRGPVGGSVLGVGVARAGDVNADGIDDFLYGESFRAHVLSGWDMLQTLESRDGVFSGGPGDDTAAFDGSAFTCMSGGRGNDTLAVTGADRVLDLGSPSRCVRGFERIDLSGSGPNVLSLSDANIRRLPQNRPGAPAPLVRTLLVVGDADDRVELDASYEPFGTNADRDVYRRPGALYGIEVRRGVQVVIGGSGSAVLDP